MPEQVPLFCISAWYKWAATRPEATPWVLFPTGWSKLWELESCRSAWGINLPLERIGTKEVKNVTYYICKLTAKCLPSGKCRKRTGRPTTYPTTRQQADTLFGCSCCFWLVKWKSETLRVIPRGFAPRNAWYMIWSAEPAMIKMYAKELLSGSG